MYVGLVFLACLGVCGVFCSVAGSWVVNLICLPKMWAIFCGIVLEALRPEPPFTEVSGPSGPEIAKSLKKALFGGLEKSLKKYLKKSKNTDFRTFLGIFSVFLDFFGYFLRPFSRPPKRPLLRLFLRFRARRARRLL